jgi:alpha-L-rhamnosidase
LQEDWDCKPDSSSQWSHCPVAPLIILQMSLAGIQPLEPGCRHVRIWPQLAGLTTIQLTAQTALGPILFKTKGRSGNRELVITIPESMQAELWLDQREKITLKKLGSGERDTLAYELPSGKETTLVLKFTQ